MTMASSSSSSDSGNASGACAASWPPHRELYGLLASVMGMNSLPDAFTTPAAFLVTMIAMACLVVTVAGLVRHRGWL